MVTRSEESVLTDGTAERMLAELAGLPPDHPRRQELRLRLVELHAPFVRSIARRYASRGEMLEDIEQAGQVGLIKAINRFDPELGNHFLAYAAPVVTGEIKKHFRDFTWVVRVPRRLQELRISIRQATEEFVKEHGRAPTVAEIAQLLDSDEEEVIDCLGTSAAYRPGSLDLPLGDGDSATMGELYGELDPALDTLIDVTALKPLLSRLPERDRTIVLLRFWGNKTQTEIAEEIGMSQMHVSRLLSRSLARLRAGLSAES
jgi:RNA polymerase sigma-70 factor (sigma-B/F/G subfamily)